MGNYLFKEIMLYNQKYFIYTNGTVIKRETNKILKPYKSNNNYLYITVNTMKGTKHLKIHRLVAKAFIPNPNNYPCVNHINGNKLDNRVENLEWCTYSKNINHAFNNDLMKSNCGKRTKVNQYDLKGNFIKTWDSMSKIEKEYNVSHTAIRFCCIGKNKTCKGYIWRYADK